MKTYRIACIPGDGIGQEVVPAGQAVLQALAAAQNPCRFEFTSFDWGGDHYRRHGVMMPTGSSCVKTPKVNTLESAAAYTRATRSRPPPTSA